MAIVGMDADIIGLMEIENNDHTKQTNSFLEEPQGHTLKYIDVISDDYFVDTSTMS
jgi:predicted extracellular nuclease